MAWQEAVQAADGGTRLLLKVTPGAAVDAFPAGHDPWTGRLRVRVTAAARDGRANQAVQRVVAAALEVPASAVTLVQGARDARKTVFVAGIGRDAALRCLEGA